MAARGKARTSSHSNQHARSKVLSSPNHHCQCCSYRKTVKSSWVARSPKEVLAQSNTFPNRHSSQREHLETPMNLNPIGFAGMAVVMCALPAKAHHSFAMFDAEKTIAIEGTVKEFQWTNPHSWIHLTVPDSEGKPVLWSIELGAPTGLARQGWVPKTLTPGMKIKLLIHPLRDGYTGGQFLHVTLPDGRQLGDPSTRGQQGDNRGP